MSLSPGTTVGPYRILETLGTGGMGEVYRARDTRLERDIALKVILPGKAADAERRKRFVQEARAASSLNHPGIVAIYDIGEMDGVDYIAMELVRGTTLDQRIPRKGMRPAQALPIAIQVADALAAAHAAGIVHRDLKPGNVMVGDDGRVKLLDFGLAKLVARGPLGDLEGSGTLSDSGPRTAQGAIVGTVSYMAPEQAEGKNVDARSDIFSFGTILYEMITGERAFKSDTTLSTLSSILKEDPKRIGTFVNDVPPELERVIVRCLRKDPERRWQGMRDIKVALEELKEESDSGVLMAPPLPAARARKGSSRAGIAIAAVVALAALAGGAWWMLRPKTEAPPETSVVATEAPEAPAPEVPLPPAKRGVSPAVPAAPKSVPRDVRLPDGTKVTLTLLEDVSSASAESGARIPLKVAQDVKVGGVVVIPKGADASATVAEVEKKRFFRRTPKLLLKVSYAKASDGESVRLRSIADAASRGTATDVLDLGVANPAEDAKGKDIVVPSGTLLVAYVDEDKLFAAPQ